jgi:phenylalanyl-tRNA synthetase beta chain
MLELGQPLHAFDAAKAEKIVVRRAKNGETIKTLDGQERELNENALLISNGEKPLAIAGIMGGQSSEIENSTTEIMLESACFDASSIRKTSTALSLRTDASVRFEKTLDPNLCPAALARCFDLIKKTCPEAKLSSHLADMANFSNESKTMEIDLNWLTIKIGQDLGKKKIVKILEALGFEVHSSGHMLKITVPSFRANKDIKIKEDVLEEIIRIHGYDNVEPQSPIIKATAPEQNQERTFERHVKNILSLGAALTEVHNYSFLNEEKMAKLKMSPSGLIKLANPISGLHTHLRAELFPNMLDNVRTNQAKYEKISVFEIGSVFADVTGSIIKSNEDGERLPYQTKHLAILIASDDEQGSYNQAKGVIEYLLKNIGCKNCRFEEPSDGGEPEWARKKTYGKILSGNEDLGFISLLGKTSGIKKEVAIAELDFDKLFMARKGWPEKKYREPNKYPALTRDLAFVISDKILYGNIKKEIESFDKLIKEVELFDVYEGANLPDGSKSLAFHVVYETPERTLETAEVDALQEKLLKHLEEKFEAKIRNF